MSGLIDSTDGLRYGAGLMFEPALGGAGLGNPSQSGSELYLQARLAGAGSARAAVSVNMWVTAGFSGVGGTSS